LPADIRPDQSAHDFINPLVRPVTPLPPLANFAVAPPQRRPRPGFFRDISLPHPRRIRMPPLVKCFGDRDLRDEAQIFWYVHNSSCRQKVSETSTLDSTANDASKRSRREDKPNNVDVADKAVPGVVIRELRAVDADQRPRCDECRRRLQILCKRSRTQKNDADRQTKTRSGTMLNKQDLGRRMLAIVSCSAAGQ
jgi:hypothetical protein